MFQFWRRKTSNVCSVIAIFTLSTSWATGGSTSSASASHKSFIRNKTFPISVDNESNQSSWKLEDHVLQFLMNHQVEQTLELNHSILVDSNDTWSADQRRRLDSNSPRHYNVTWVYPSVCGHLPVQESTATLLVARAHAKAGNTKLAWSILESLFDGQADNGFMPQYLYSRQLNETENYITNTSIPNWRLFDPFFNDMDDHNSVSFQPPSVVPHYLGWRTSLRISALPLHASIVHDIFLTSRQSLDDVVALERHVHRIFSQHEFIHDVVMRNCQATTSPNTSSSNRQDEAILANSGCYNILHPWESLASMASPMWKPAINATIQRIKSKLWKRSWPLPVHIRQQHSYFDSEPTYNASIFMLECIANATTTNHSCSDSLCEEDWLLSSCPYFAMLDVGYAAALTKSDVDLYQSLQILLDRRETKERDPTDRAKFWKGRMAQVRKWQEQNDFIWDELLWNQEKETFSSRYLTFQSVTMRNSSALLNATSHTLPIATSNDFLASWAAAAPDKRLQTMAARLMQKHGADSFDCGDVGLWPRGGCDKGSHPINTTVEIDPLVNWLVGSGLQRSGEVALGKYLDQSTMQLVCGWKQAASLRIGWFPLNVSTCGSPSFQTAYSVGSNYDVIHHVKESCDTTYLATAALVFDILVPDTTQHEIPTPPIRNSWVITLIAVELVVAFSIGLSCLSLSWILTCRLKSYQSNEFIPSPGGMNGRRLGYLPSNAESVGEPYFSAHGSYASSEELDDSLSLTSNDNAESGTPQQS